MHVEAILTFECRETFGGLRQFQGLLALVLVVGKATDDPRNGGDDKEKNANVPIIAFNVGVLICSRRIAVTDLVTFSQNAEVRT